DRGGILGRRESVDFWTSPLEPRGRSVRSPSCLGAARIPGRKHRVDWSGVSRTLETHAKAVAAPTASMAVSRGTKRSNINVLAAARNVCFWHKADILVALTDVCFWG